MSCTIVDEPCTGGSSSLMISPHPSPDDTILSHVEQRLKRLVILFIGAPGSGKGTQAMLLSKRLQIPHISTGDVCRAEVARGTDAGRIIGEYMQHGECAPVSITDAVFAAALRAIPRSSGFILDGYPRTAGQIEEAHALLQQCGRSTTVDRVILLEASESVSISRLADRLICSECQRTPQNYGAKCIDCSHCGAKETLVQRIDDADAEIRATRVAEYSGEILRLRKYYEERDLLWCVDASQAREQVSTDIVSALQRSVTHSAQLSAYQLLLMELTHPTASPGSVMHAIRSWMPLALEENIHKRTGRMRRFVAAVSNNPWKLNEYVRFFDQYGIEVVGIPRQVCEGAFADIAMKTLLVDCRTSQIVPLGVLREFSNLFKPTYIEQMLHYNTAVAAIKHSSTRPKRNEHSSLRDGVRADNISHLTYWYSPRSEARSVHRVDVEQIVHGRIEHSKRSSDATVSPVFAWDDIFVVEGGQRSYAELATAGHKVSARDRVLSQFVHDHVHYRQPKNLNHFPLRLKRVVDFRASVETFVDENRYLSLPASREFGIRNMLDSVMDQGIFFRASSNRRQLTYWLPSLNAGLPLTAKADPVHEITYMIHDFFHFRMPDLTPLHHRSVDVSTEESVELRSIYTAYRMMSEAITIVLADAVFVEALQRSFSTAPELAEYDFGKRKIYPLFAATGLLHTFASQEMSPSQRIQALRRLLYANVQFVLKGNDEALRELLPPTLENSEALLADYKAKYSPFFAEDYRWTLRNYDHMTEHGKYLAEWWVHTARIREDLQCESVQDFRGALCRFEAQTQRHEGDLVDRIFAFIFERDVIPSLFSGELAPAITTIDPVNRSILRTKRAFLRYMTGQMYLFTRFAPVAGEWLGAERVSITDSLVRFRQAEDDNKISGLDGVLSEIDSIRHQFDSVVDRLATSNLLSPDDAITYKEVHPIFPAFFVSYDHHLDEDENTLKSYYNSTFSSSIRGEVAKPVQQISVTSDCARYTQIMVRMIVAGGGTVTQLPDMGGSSHEQVTVVTRPGVLLLATSTGGESTGVDSNTDGCRSITFLFAGVSVETSLELIAHSEASVARLTTSRTSAMDNPLYTIDTDAPERSQMEYILESVRQHRTFFSREDHRHSVTGSSAKLPLNQDEKQGRKSTMEWRNVAQSGSKATVLSYTMRLHDLHKLLTGRLPVPGNENGVRHVLTRVCNTLHAMYPHIIMSPEAYACGSNISKYTLQSPTPPPSSASAQPVKAQSRNTSDHFLPPACRALFITRLTREARQLMDALIPLRIDGASHATSSSHESAVSKSPVESFTDAERLAEFQSRITYLAFPAQITAEVSRAYLHRMVHELGHLSILSATHAAFELRLSRSAQHPTTSAAAQELLLRLATTFKLHIERQSRPMTTNDPEHHTVIVTGSLKQWYIFVKDSAVRRRRQDYLGVDELWLLNVVEAALSHEFPLLFRVPEERFACLSHATADKKWSSVLSEVCKMAPYATFLNVYRFGSCNYGTSHESSDLDLMVVCKEDEFNRCAIVTPRYNLNFYSREHFSQRLLQQRICAIEALSHPLVQCHQFTFKLNLRTLRSSIDHIVYFSLMKGERKLLSGKQHLVQDTYIAKKQIFHAYRITACAIELCESGRVQAWNRWCHIYDSVMGLRCISIPPEQDTWNAWMSVWRPQIDTLLERFHTLAQKK